MVYERLQTKVLISLVLERALTIFNYNDCPVCCAVSKIVNRKSFEFEPAMALDHSPL